MLPIENKRSHFLKGEKKYMISVSLVSLYKEVSNALGFHGILSMLSHFSLNIASGFP